MLPDHVDSTYIDGRWIEPHGTRTLPVHDATTEQVIARIPVCDGGDVAIASAAAARAQPAWWAIGAEARAAVLRRVADELRAHREELIDTIIAEVGSPRRLAETMQVDIAIDTFADAAQDAEVAERTERIRNSVVRFEPVGVVGAITPWNYPLYQSALKVAAAMAAGCTVVHKPSELAPLNAVALARAMQRAAVPAGVYNLVLGDGATTGDALTRDALIDMVSFTGSTRAGRSVAANAAETVKRVSLELGGKGASVVLPGSDLPTAVARTVSSCFSNAGQTCGALSRLIVCAEDVDEVEALVQRSASEWVPGDPRDRDTLIGPVISAGQRERVVSYIDSGVSDGFPMLAGGGGDAAGPLPAAGYFVRPTVFSRVVPSATIAQEEIFGPVLAVIVADDPADAVSIANSSAYGLSVAVWAATLDEAEGIGRQLHAGSVSLNGAPFNPAAPFGGVKQSGYGRERGRYGVEEFLRTKSYHLPRD